jgi:hypothetical protein
MKMYGITIDDYDRMLEAQGGGCGICGSDSYSSNKWQKFFAVDHCHSTGRVRGLLCLTCNVSLGKFERYKEKMLDYLAKT